MRPSPKKYTLSLYQIMTSIDSMMNNKAAIYSQKSDDIRYFTKQGPDCNEVECLHQQLWFVELLLDNNPGREDYLHLIIVDYRLVCKPNMPQVTLRLTRQFVSVDEHVRMNKLNGKQYHTILHARAASVACHPQPQSKVSSLLHLSLPSVFMLYEAPHVSPLHDVVV
jgi:hypothetical protein